VQKLPARYPDATRPRRGNVAVGVPTLGCSITKQHTQPDRYAFREHLLLSACAVSRSGRKRLARAVVQVDMSEEHNL